MDYNTIAAIGSEWKTTERSIQIDDVCIVIPLKQEYLCSYKVSYKQFDYLYFGSFDYKKHLFAIQVKQNGQNYVRILDKKSEKIFALRLYKKARQYES